MEELTVEDLDRLCKEHPEMRDLKEAMYDAHGVLRGSKNRCLEVDKIEQAQRDLDTARESYLARARQLLGSRPWHGTTPRHSCPWH
jgi:hypothetical protein